MYFFYFFKKSVGENACCNTSSLSGGMTDSKSRFAPSNPNCMASSTFSSIQACTAPGSKRETPSESKFTRRTTFPPREWA